VAVVAGLSPWFGARILTLSFYGRLLRIGDRDGDRSDRG
jgi:hypothetical protein